MVISFKVVPLLFGTDSIGQLPFEPPGFLRKITQRGIENGGTRDFSPVGILLVLFAFFIDNPIVGLHVHMWYEL